MVARRFAQLARQARQQARMTLREVAEGLGRSVAYVSEIERGNRQAPSMQRAERWADVVKGDRVVFREAALADREDGQVSPEHVADLGRRATPLLAGAYDGPGNRPRVFVSSTISDFRDLRSALKFWLTDLGLEVRMSEFNDFARRPEKGTFESCFDAIDGCDYYVLLVGGRKGSEYLRGVSVTQEEYRRAAALARQGRIKPIVFIRTDVLAALTQREATLKRLRQVGADDKIFAEASKASAEGLQDPEFVASFLDEIKQTEFEREGTEGPAGALWYYRFHDFEQVTEALRVNLRLYGSVNRQILLANLKWELEENIAALVGKFNGGPHLHAGWLSALRDLTDLNPKELRPLSLTTHQADQAMTFWMLSRAAVGKLRDAALKAAIASGEFLLYQQESGRLVAGSVHTTMQVLDAAIDRYRGVSESLEERQVQWTAVMQAVVERRPRIDVDQGTVIFLFAAHDRMVDIVRLSMALLRYILDPTGAVRMPTLTPISPLKDSIEGLQREQVTHEEVERWARDKVMWSWMTGEHLYSAAEAEASFAENPGYWNPILEAVDEDLRRFFAEHKDEFTAVLKAEGKDAALAWVQRAWREESEA